MATWLCQGKLCGKMVQKPYSLSVILNSIRRISIGTHFFSNKKEQKHGAFFKVRPKLEQKHTLSWTIISEQHFATANLDCKSHDLLIWIKWHFVYFTGNTFPVLFVSVSWLSSTQLIYPADLSYIFWDDVWNFT